VHAADHDFVVPAGQAVLDRALQHGQHAVQPRASGRAGTVPHAIPGRGQAPAGEVSRQVLLRCREHVHHERAVSADGPQGQAPEVKADQHERRIQRQRADGAGRGADRLAFFVY
jgi:hypothetical protein